MIDIIINTFYYLVFASYAIPLLTIFLIKENVLRQYIPALLLIVTNFIAVVFEVVFVEVFENCCPIYHISVFTSTTLTLLYFIQSKLSPKISILFLILTFLIFSYESIYLNGWMSNNIILTIFSNICIGLISFLNLFRLFSSYQETVIQFRFHFIINAAFFIYNSSAFYISLFESHIRAEYSLLFLIVYPIFSVMNILQNILISKGIWQLKMT